MSLLEKRSQRILTLCGLYFAQGVPWGFMLITLPNYLAFHYSVSTEDTGKLIAIILVPWSFKLIWTPLMDTFTIRSMGRRRPWIIFAELMMAATLLGFIGLSNPSEHIRFIIWMYFLHNCFASLQDVCTDALAVDILPPDEQGKMNGLMWGSKLVGKGLGGWGLSKVINGYGIEACVFVQIAILLAIMLIPILVLERPGEKRFPWSAGKAGTEQAKRSSLPLTALWIWLKNLLYAFMLPTTAVYIVFTLVKLIGIGVNEVITKTLFTQQLGWTDEELSAITGLWVTFPIIAAAILGGHVADRFGRRKVLMFGFGGYAIVALVFALTQHLWLNKTYSATCLIAWETLNAIGSVGFLSMGMRISWSKSAATVFTTYMTLSNVSHVVGNAIAGSVQKFFLPSSSGSNPTTDQILQSYEGTFYFVAVAAALPLLLLIFVRPEEVDEAEAKAAEEASTESNANVDTESASTEPTEDSDNPYQPPRSL